VLRQYLAWWEEDGLDSGPTTASVLEKVRRGTPPALAAAQVHATHSHPLAGDGAAAVVVLCRALLRGQAWAAALERAAAGRLDETAQALRNAHAGPRGPGGYAPEVLRPAVYFVGTAETFEQALSRSLAFAGPANYGPVLVGAIASARWGQRGQR
jgi:ADP-ribosylglycohydrolase